MQQFPGYEGDLDPLGKISIYYNENGGFLTVFDMFNLGSLCSIGDPGTQCPVYLAEKSSCDSVSGPYSAPNATKWSVKNGAWYSTFDSGVSNSAFKFDNGYNIDENIGHAIIVEDSKGVAIGCGILGEERKDKILKAEMGIYPGYTGELEAFGTVNVTYYDDDTFNFYYDVSGLEPHCKNCGIHIHAGVSCNTAEEVKGHFWNSEKVQDLWTVAGGAVYHTNKHGEGYSSFNTNNGYGYDMNIHHAVVIHAQNGQRVSCGELM